MKLWTTMPKSVYEDTIIKKGKYVCNENKCGMLLEDSTTHQFQNAYDWLVNYMTRIIGPAPDGIKYPVWAWYRLRGREKRPDLSWVEYKGFKEPMVLLEIEISDNKVVLSDEEKWTCAQLNNAPWCDTDEELDWYYDDNSVSSKEKEEFKNKSWYKVFNIDESQNVQATFWEIRKENVKKVWYYNN